MVRRQRPDGGGEVVAHAVVVFVSVVLVGFLSLLSVTEDFNKGRGSGPLVEVLS